VEKVFIAMKNTSPGKAIDILRKGSSLCLTLWVEFDTMGRRSGSSTIPSEASWGSRGIEKE
jgi:hypothetical protein